MRKIFLALFCVFAALLFGCKKEVNTIGLDLQDEDILNADYMEIPMDAYSVLDDSINTRNLLNNVVGQVTDPIFGTTTAITYTNFALTGNSVVFPEDATLDSVVLTLQYSGFFGDTTSPLSFDVFELNEDLSASAYYGSDYIDLSGSENLVHGGGTIIYPKPNTQVTVDSSSSAPHLRIRLKNSFGNRLMDMSSSSLTSTTSFQADFKGLSISATKTGGGIGNLCYISLTSSMSGLVLYYHNSQDESKKYTFPINGDCVRYNCYLHGYETDANSQFRNQVIQGNHSLGSELLYAQPTGGVKTRVNMPQLYEMLGNKNVVINRAELVLTNVSTDGEYFFQPYNLSLQLLKKDNTTAYTPDDATQTSTSYFGGVYDEKTKQYRFRITKYIQQCLRSYMQNGEIPDQGLNVVVAGAGIRANRLIFRGTDPIYSDRFRLEIYYTEY